MHSSSLIKLYNTTKYPTKAAVQQGLLTENTAFSVEYISVAVGSVFGDHCSPMTDCTVLAALGSDCEIMDHVRTQMPYALTVAVTAVFCGTLPATLGFPAWASLLIGCAAIAAVLYIVGKRP